MQNFFTKKIITIILALTVLGGGVFVLVSLYKKAPELPSTEQENLVPMHKVVGTSVEERNIEAYTYGKGETHLLFIGGIHGGYEYNSVLLAYKLIDYLNVNTDIIPDNITITVIPSANPDGLYEVTGKEGRFSITDVVADTEEGQGRFNANGVDLNRNFDCKWQQKSKWRGNIVSAGSKAFSEPEAVTIRNFVLKNNPDAVIFWHSQSNAVYASECEDGILPETLEIMNAYSLASGYPAVDSFDAYEITGDAEGWLASINIPAITVELKTHETVEWDRNLAGIRALFAYYEHKMDTSK